jgi:hypothetical protein
LRTHFTQPDTLFDKYFEHPDPTGIAAPNAISDTLREVTHDEVSHYDHIFQQRMLQDQNHFMRNKESHIHALLYDLGCHVHQIDGSDRAWLKL